MIHIYIVYMQRDLRDSSRSHFGFNMICSDKDGGGRAKTWEMKKMFSAKGFQQTTIFNRRRGVTLGTRYQFRNS